MYARGRDHLNSIQPAEESTVTVLQGFNEHSRCCKSQSLSWTVGQKAQKVERARGSAEPRIMALTTFSLCLLTFSWVNFPLVRGNNRHAVYWNSSNIHLRREGYTVQVNVNDYLDIYCPHYNLSLRGALDRGMAEQYVLYMVSYRGYRACDPQMGFKRWECNRPHAPHAPIKFSEKFQRYSAFSLGYEFNVGHEYYYISTPVHHHGHSCLRLRVYVCCSTVSNGDGDSDHSPSDYTDGPDMDIHNIDDFNSGLPKLERSISGSSPSRDRLLVTVASLLLASLLVS